VVEGVGVQQLNCWHRRFESRRGHSSVVFFVCCVGIGIRGELLARSKEFCRMCVCVCVWCERARVHQICHCLQIIWQWLRRI
jgi:hypothetical protein